MHGIGKPFQGGVPHQCCNHQGNGEHLNRDRGTKEDFGISHDPLFIVHVYLRRGPLGNESYPAGCLPYIGIQDSNKVFVFRLGHLVGTSDAGSPA